MSSVMPNVLRYTIVRHFRRYTSEESAMRRASHRMSNQQGDAIGEFFWTADNVPGVSFKTRKAARSAAIAKAEGRS